MNQNAYLSKPSAESLPVFSKNGTGDQVLKWNSSKCNLPKILISNSRRNSRWIRYNCFSSVLVFWHHWKMHSLNTMPRAKLNCNVCVPQCNISWQDWQILLIHVNCFVLPRSFVNRVVCSICRPRKKPLFSSSECMFLLCLDWIFLFSADFRLNIF